jgi:hypothetical protein
LDWRCAMGAGNELPSRMEDVQLGEYGVQILSIPYMLPIFRFTFAKQGYTEFHLEMRR